MVLAPIIRAGTFIVKHRKAIYAVLTAQDRYISKSFKYGGYGKATSYGVRSGALGGSIIGSFLSNPVDDLTNGSPIQQESPSGNQYEKRTRDKYNTRSRYKQYIPYSGNYRRQRYACRPKFRRKR